MDKIKNKNYIFAFVIAVILMFILLFLINREKIDKGSASNTNKNNYALLNDASMFYTIEGSINRYLEALSNKRVDDLILLLDNDYLIEKKINSDNILDNLDNLDGIYTFSAKKIYFEKLSRYENMYYVYGLLKKDMLKGVDYGTDYYLKVKINHEKLLFSITPYDGKIFKED